MQLLKLYESTTGFTEIEVLKLKCPNCDSELKDIANTRVDWSVGGGKTKCSKCY